MPRSKKTVKGKLLSRSPGLIDLHFHGAFGVDLMHAETSELERMAMGLYHAGLDGFCPTTLSTESGPLLSAVSRLGDWMADLPSGGRSEMALPLGIHLEGPFLNLSARGAHPPGAVRPFNPKELQALWDASRGHLKILTLAPEGLSPKVLQWLTHWSRDKKHVVLSAGHSRATTAQARQAFDSGFTAVTHAWNAMAFHQREAGILGAALGRKGVHVELIGDGAHVSPEVVRWTCQLHREICWVSDCTPAAATKLGTEHRFGPLPVRLSGDGASRLPDGSLAGGGKLLPEALREWVETELRRAWTGGERIHPATATRLLKTHLRYGCIEPLRALQHQAPIGRQKTGGRSRPRRLEWRLTDQGRLTFSAEHPSG